MSNDFSEIDNAENTHNLKWLQEILAQNSPLSDDQKNKLSDVLDVELQRDRKRISQGTFDVEDRQFIMELVKAGAKPRNVDGQMFVKRIMDVAQQEHKHDPALATLHR